MPAVKGYASGKVQGVWYRKSVQQGCEALGLCGYAKNLEDGRVEVLLMGNEAQLEMGRRVVQSGSPASEVEAIEWVDLAVTAALSGFRVL